MVFRPLEILDSEPRSLIDHILNPDERSPKVRQGFASAFGRECLDALQDALAEPLAVSTLPAVEFPIIFLPRPGGGDIQATPLAPAAAYEQMRNVQEPYFRKREDGQPPPPRGWWCNRELSAHPQNISAAIGPSRVRFFARMPQVAAYWEALLYRYAHGGPFPRWRDDKITGSVLRYARLLEQDYSNSDIRQALDRRADAIIAAARAFLSEVTHDVQKTFLDASPEKPPLVADLVCRMRWTSTDDRAKGRLAVTSDHFKRRVARVTSEDG